MSINLFFLLDTSEAYSSVFSPPGCRSPPRRRRRSSPVAGGAQPGVSLSLYLCRLLTSPWASASSSISGAPPSADRPAPPRCAPSPPTPQPPPPPPQPAGFSLTGRSHLGDERNCQNPRSKRSRALPRPLHSGFVPLAFASRAHDLEFMLWK